MDKWRWLQRSNSGEVSSSSTKEPPQVSPPDGAELYFQLGSVISEVMIAGQKRREFVLRLRALLNQTFRVDEHSIRRAYGWEKTLVETGRRRTNGYTPDGRTMLTDESMQVHVSLGAVIEIVRQRGSKEKSLRYKQDALWLDAYALGLQDNNYMASVNGESADRNSVSSNLQMVTFLADDGALWHAIPAEARPFDGVEVNTPGRELHLGRPGTF